MTAKSPARRRVLRAGTVLGAVAAAVLLTAGPAAAHVTAQPGEAEAGSYAKIAFRVPTESETAGTVSLVVTLPLDHPITSVRTTPRPGWTATLAKAPLDPPVQAGNRTVTEAVRTITWAAQPGSRIGPGEFVTSTSRWARCRPTSRAS